MRPGPISGLANAVVPVDELNATVAAVVERIVAGPPCPVDDQAHARRRRVVSLVQALESEAIAQNVNLGSDGHGRGVRGLREKRTPTFRGR